MKNKVMLIILDGVGAAPRNQGNAVTLSNPKNLTRLWGTFPHTYLLASGASVGLSDGVKGNSEVGHLNIGAGSVVTQIFPRINRSIESGAFLKNNTLWDALMHVVSHQSDVHLMGCFSDGSVHAHINHFKAILEFFAQNKFKKNVYIHAFTDGRDTPPDASRKFFAQMDEQFRNLGIGKFGTVCGRSISMDRSRKWERTKKAYDLLIHGIGNRFATWQEVIDDSYSKKISDEFIEPAIIVNGNEVPTVKENDAVIFVNFRADRSLQLSAAISDPTFKEFETVKFKNVFFASMAEYKKGFPKTVLFPKEYISMPIGKLVSTNSLRQLRIAETEKFPHVTYFLNGGMSIKYEGEDRLQIPSAHVSTYDQKPEMSLLEIFEVLKYRIGLDMYDFIVLNIANGDMVGHTGNLAASIKAMQIVDYITNELVKLFTAHNGTVFITADHGNVEEVINLKTGEIDTEHSYNPVPFIIVDPKLPKTPLPYGALKDIAPTMLKVLGIPQPSEMTGKSLI